MSEEWEKELTPEMLPNEMHRKIAEKIGAENLLKLADVIGGFTFYLPKRDQLSRPLRNQKIKEEYTGYNALKLSKKYNVSVRWIEQLGKKQSNTEDTK